MPLTPPAAVSAYPTGWRNLLHNGAMQISQRAISNSPLLTTSGTIVDRWKMFIDNGAGGAPGGTLVCAPDNSVAAPGFTLNSLVTISGADSSIAAGDIYTFQQGIEGLNCQQLMWGTTSAKPVALSFWVYSSVAGTFAGSLRSNNNARSYVFTYTVTSSGTWQKITVLIPGDTGGSVLVNNNAEGLNVAFSLGAGTTYQTATTSAWVAGNFVQPTSGVSNIVATAGATIRFTGIQLEVGNAVTPFEARPYGVELALCQRYFCIIGKSTLTGAMLSTGGQVATATAAHFQYKYPVTMRATPIVTSSLASATWATTTVGINVNNRAATFAVTAISANANSHNQDVADLQCTSTGLTVGQSVALTGNAAQAYLAFTVEL